MNTLARRIVAIVALCIMPVFVVFLILALGNGYNGIGVVAVPIASVSGCLVLILFLALKMDEYAKRNRARAAELRNAELGKGEEALDRAIEDGTAQPADGEGIVPTQEANASSATDSEDASPEEEEKREE